LVIALIHCGPILPDLAEGGNTKGAVAFSLLFVVETARVAGRAGQVARAKNVHPSGAVPGCARRRGGEAHFHLFNPTLVT